MSTIANELLTLNNTKLAIKEAIINKGVEVGEEDTFASYADKIDEIEASGGEIIDISKIHYQIGTTNIGLYNGKELKGFRDMGGYCSFPVTDENNVGIDVDWSDSFEIGVRFKLTSYPSSDSFQFLFGCGMNGTTYRFYTPSCFIGGSTHGLAVQLGASSNSWLVTEDLDYTISLDTWYFTKIKFVKSTMLFTVDISTDLETFTNLYTTTLSSVPYYNSSAYLAFGGDCRQYNRATNNCSIDVYNTYVKDSTDSIVWGCFEEQGAEYELWDYIESDGTQYIDTGIKVVQGQIIKTIFHPLNNQPSYAWLFGAGDTTHYYGFQFPQQTLLYIYNGSTSSSGQISVNTADEYVYNLTLTASSPLNLSYYIFGFHYSEDPNGGVNLGKFRLYSFSIDNNFYLPCKRKSDGAFGLWDVENQIFLGDSAGGNAFVGGKKIGNINIASPSTDEDPLEKYSIDAKLKYSYSTGSGGSQQTYTYTFDEDGFYLCYISTWGNAGQTSSITYSGTYTEYFTKDCSGKMKMSVVYVTAGTVVTMYLSSAYWMYNAVAIKLKGFNHIGNELFSNVSASSENISFSNLSSSKTMICTYFIDSDNGGISIETYPKTYEISYTNFNQIIVWDGVVMPAGSWPARLGIIFFNSDSNLGGIIKRCAGQVGAIFHVFEVS